MPAKVIEGLAAKGDFEALSKFTAAQARAPRPQPLSPLHQQAPCNLANQNLEGLGCLVRNDCFIIGKYTLGIK